MANSSRRDAYDVGRRIEDLAALAVLVSETETEPLYVRWSRDVAADLESETSRDELTGIELPGLSVNPLRPEPWWAGRPLEVWLARRLHDYHHLRERDGRRAKAWILTGEEAARGPDNEPLIVRCAVVGHLDDDAADEAARIIDELPGDWGTLRRA